MTYAEFNEMFRERTLDFAVWMLKFLNTLQSSRTSNTIIFQLGKSVTSVGVNFRVFCRRRSKNEKFAKICIVVKEADESDYWFLIMQKMGLGNSEELNFLLNENIEIIKITAKIKSGLNSQKK